jgi:hypothetical protein
MQKKAIQDLSNLAARSQALILERKGCALVCLQGSVEVFVDDITCIGILHELFP